MRRIDLTDGSDTSPPVASAVGGDVYLSSRDFLLQAIGNYLGEPESSSCYYGMIGT